jgi:hypothetical protein
LPDEFYNRAAITLSELLLVQPNYFLFRQGQLGLIGAILERFSISEAGPAAAKLAFNAMANHQLALYDEGLLLLEQVVRCVGPASIEFASRIQDQITVALSSNEPRLIADMLRLVGSLVCAARPQLDDLFTSSWDFITAQTSADGGKHLPAFYPFFARAVARFVDAAAVLRRTECREGAIKVFRTLLIMPYNKTDRSSVEWANELYAGVLVGYEAILRLMAEDDGFLIRDKLSFVEPLSKILLLPKILEVLLWAICDFVRTMWEVMGRLPRCHVVLKGERMFKVLTWALISKNGSIVARATVLWNTLKQKDS